MPGAYTFVPRHAVTIFQKKVSTVDLAARVVILLCVRTGDQAARVVILLCVHAGDQAARVVILLYVYMYVVVIRLIGCSRSDTSICTYW